MVCRHAVGCKRSSGPVHPYGPIELSVTSALAEARPQERAWLEALGFMTLVFREAERASVVAGEWGSGGLRGSANRSRPSSVRFVRVLGWPLYGLPL